MLPAKIAVVEGFSLTPVDDLISHDWLFRLIQDMVQFVPQEEADFLFVSETAEAQLSALRCKKGSVRIFVANEATTPDFNLWDYALGFDHLRLANRYFRPHPLIRYGHRVGYNSLEALNRAEIDTQTGFCSFIYSNSKAHPFRDEFFRALDEVLAVDSLGSHLTNTADRGLSPRNSDDWVTSKIRVESSYKFSLSFENALFPGYTSEKVLTAYAAGAIPIYWGNPCINVDFNEKAIVNLHSFRNKEQAIERILSIYNSLEIYEDISAQPITHEPVFDVSQRESQRVRAFFRGLFLKPVIRRPLGTFASSYENRMRSNLYLWTKMRNIKKLAL